MLLASSIGWSDSRMKLLEISPNKEVSLQPTPELATRQNLVSSPVVSSDMKILSATEQYIDEIKPSTPTRLESYDLQISAQKIILFIKSISPIVAKQPPSKLNPVGY